MITYKKMDITTVERGIIVHGVNCQMKMASGVAGAIKKKWPAVYDAFMEHTERELGHAVAVEIIPKELYVVNGYTQEFYGKDGKKYADPEAIRMVLRTAFLGAFTYNLPVYMPKIGCGLGGLHWENDVLPIVEKLNEQWDALKPKDPALYPLLNLTICEI